MGAGKVPLQLVDSKNGRLCKRKDDSSATPLTRPPTHPLTASPQSILMLARPAAGRRGGRRAGPPHSVAVVRLDGIAVGVPAVA